MWFYKTLRRAQLGSTKFNDQNELRKLIDDIKGDVFPNVWNDNDLLHFQPYKEKTENIEEQEFRVVYQSVHMAKMLSKYGENASCIDATYKTTRVQSCVAKESTQATQYSTFDDCFQFL